MKTLTKTRKDVIKMTEGPQTVVIHVPLNLTLLMKDDFLKMCQIIPQLSTTQKNQIRWSLELWRK